MTLRQSALLLSVGLTLCFPDLAAAQQCFTPASTTPVTTGDAAAREVVFTSALSNGIVSKFTLARTLDNILKTSRVDPTAPVTDAQREELLTSLLGTFEQNTLGNPHSGLTFPVTVRSGEAALEAHDMLSAGGSNEMVPVGLFNRLDLAPKSFANCGEYRIVYARKGGAGTDRFFLIFEAALPNADPNGSAEGCKEVASFWQGLKTADDATAGTQLEHFYYDGGVVPGGTVSFEPVVDYRHYGLPDGQVRANAFIPDSNSGFVWHLLQWQTALDASGVPAFHNAPVNETPVPALFGPPTIAAQPAAAFDQLTGLFRNEFAARNVWQLIDVDRTALVQPTSAETLIDKLGVDIDDKYYAVESNANGSPSDSAARRAANTPLAAGIAQTLSDAKVDQCSITPLQVLNRMDAMTCGGCHQFAAGAEIAPGIDWPQSLGFVQIDEQGALSPLLTDHFLPARIANLERTVGHAFLDTEQTPAGMGSQRAQLNQLLAGLKSKGQGFVDDPAADTNLALAVLLNEQVRQASRAEPGAFTTFRQPD